MVEGGLAGVVDGGGVDWYALFQEPEGEEDRVSFGEIAEFVVARAGGEEDGAALLVAGVDVDAAEEVHAAVNCFLSSVGEDVMEQGLVVIQRLFPVRAVLKHETDRLGCAGDVHVLEGVW